jgi:hypothetical protein
VKTIELRGYPLLKPIAREIADGVHSADIPVFPVRGGWFAVATFRFAGHREDGVEIWESGICAPQS